MSDEQTSLHAKKNLGGRPPERGESKRSPISMRTTPSIRAALELAAEREGRSLAQEIEQRLERSVAEEAVRGGAHNVRLLDAIAAEIATIEELTGSRWHEDPTTFHLITLAVPEMLKRHAPPIANNEVVAKASAEYAAAKAKVDEAKAYLASIGAWALPMPDALLNNPPAGMFGGERPATDTQLSPALGALLQAGIAAGNFDALAGDEFDQRIDAMYKRKLYHDDGSEFSALEKDAVADAIRQVRDLERIVKDRMNAFMEAYEPQMRVVREAAELFKNIREARMSGIPVSQGR